MENEELAEILTFRVKEQVFGLEILSVKEIMEFILPFRVLSGF